MDDLRRWRDLLVETLEPPAILYHYTSPNNRDSISRDGLLASKSQIEGEAIYMASKLSPVGHGDIWQGGLDIESDFQVPEDEEDTWWVTYDDIPPNRLRLIRAA